MGSAMDVAIYDANDDAIYITVNVTLCFYRRTLMNVPVSRVYTKEFV